MSGIHMLHDEDQDQKQLWCVCVCDGSMSDHAAEHVLTAELV